MNLGIMANRSVQETGSQILLQFKPFLSCFVTCIQKLSMGVTHEYATTVTYSSGLSQATVTVSAATAGATGSTASVAAGAGTSATTAVAGGAVATGIATGSSASTTQRSVTATSQTTPTTAATTTTIPDSGTISIFNFITARKRSLGQGIIVTSVCHSFCSQGGWLPSRHHRSHD